MGEAGKLIAFVSNSAWSVYNFRFDVIRSLKSQGYTIMVIATEDEFTIHLKQAGCKFVNVRFNNRTGNPVTDYLFFRKLKRIYQRFRPHFIFHYVTKPNIYGSLAAGSLHIDSVAVVTGLGYAFAKKDWLHLLVKNLYARALSRVKEVWFLNHDDAKMFVERRVVQPSKVRILPGEGINTTWFSRTSAYGTQEQPFSFLMSTRLLKSKGIGTYAEASRILQEKKYPVRCLLIGFFEPQHPDSLSTTELAGWQQQGLLIYQGFMADVRPFLERADCFVFPSAYHEGIPRALMEAASMELPVITSDNRGCKEVVVNGETGFLCQRNDPADLARQMEEMMGLSITERREMGRKGRALVVEKFEVGKTVEEYRRVLGGF